MAKAVEEPPTSLAQGRALLFKQPPPHPPARAESEAPWNPRGYPPAKAPTAARETAVVPQIGAQGGQAQPAQGETPPVGESPSDPLADTPRRRHRRGGPP